MEFIKTAIPDIVLIKPLVHGDARGFFMETYQQKVFSEAGIQAEFVQDNHSGSQKGILRGLHYQIQQPQGKLVRVVAGEVFDVAVDLRCSSPTFGQWVGAVLSAENKHMLWVPPGFAHGYFVISDWAEFTYKTTDFYAPQYERTLMWNDPEIGVTWPLAAGQTPTLSAKDAVGKSFKEIELFK